jgi:hypothetical protein
MFMLTARSWEEGNGEERACRMIEAVSEHMG